MIHFSWKMFGLYFLQLLAYAIFTVVCVIIFRRGFHLNKEANAYGFMAGIGFKIVWDKICQWIDSVTVRQDSV